MFVNELEEPVEATYEFPAEHESVVSKLLIELGDRIVVAKVMAKSDAYQKYEDTIARGNAAVMVEEVKDKREMLKFTIGNIQS